MQLSQEKNVPSEGTRDSTILYTAHSLLKPVINAYPSKLFPTTIVKRRDFRVGEFQKPHSHNPKSQKCLRLLVLGHVNRSVLGLSLTYC